MHTTTYWHIAPDDTPAATIHIGGAVAIRPDGSDYHVQFFASAADARRWLEDALDAITDAEGVSARAGMDQLDACHDPGPTEQGEAGDPRQSTIRGAA